MEVNSIIQRLRGSRRAVWLLIPGLLVLLGVAGTRDIPAATAQAVGTVTVQKALVNPSGQAVTGDLSGYVFTLASGGATITMPATNAQGQTTLGVAAGNYTITEASRPGSTLVDFKIGGTAVGSFAVTAGQTVTITATNQVAGTASIAINKQIVDAQGAIVAGADRSGFQFTVANLTGFTANLTTDANGAVTVGNLGAGTYTVTEQPRQGWTLVSMTINGVPAANGQQFQLAAGGTASVIANNRQGAATGTVTIAKQVVDQSGNVVATADRSGFQVAVNCATGTTQFSANVTTDSSGAATLSNVPAGNCTVTEASRSGWTLVSIFVGSATTDIGNGGTFAVTAGQTTTLTIRNRSSGPAPGQTEQVQLFTGCNNVTVTWPNGTPTSTVAQNISPGGVLVAIWRFDNANQRFVGFSPIPNAPNDLVTVDRAQPVFICTNGNGTLNRPVI
jgi:hypothetical protein